tara:strand:+ start:1146 stop:3377 length:2232 start_codon:yes stop_codon:yes gene_type:complete
MQTFYEHLKENTSTLDSLGHDMPMSSKRKKQLESDKGIFKDFNIEQWLDYEYPKNSSVITKQELKILQSYELYRDNAKEFMKMVDEKIMKPFKQYYKEHDLPLKDIEEAERIKNQFRPIVLQLKVHYNRPRPQKLAKAMIFYRQSQFNVFPLKTAETPSYPSGHATEGRFVSLFLADKVPFEHKGNIKKLGDDVGNSRQIAGVHYPTDTEFGHQLAGAFYTHYKEKSGIKEHKIHFHGISLEEEAFTIPINEPKHIDSFPTDLDKGELKKLLKYLKTQTEVVPIAGGNEGGIKVRISDTETKEWVKQNINLKLKYGKGSLGKEPSPSGEDWEAMITVGQRTRKGKDPSKETPDEWDRVSRKELWTGTLITQSETLAKEFDKIGLPNLTQTGSGKGGGKVSKEWSKWGGKNATPKTDIMSGKKRISLKKAGGSQVMSAKAPEGIATFNAASKMMGKNAPKETAKIIDFMQNETMDLTGSGYKGSVTDLEKELETSKGNPQKMKNLKPFKDELDATRKNIGTLTTKIVKVFNDNPTFKKHFVFEAATGQVKFGDTSPSRADVMVEFDDAKGKITHNYSLKSVDEADVQTLTNLYKFYAAFKSAGKSSPYISIRGAVTKTPQQVMNFTKRILSDEYEKDTHMTFSAIINDALTMNEYGRKMLHENSIEQLDEFALFDKIKKGLSNINKKVRDKFTQMFNWIKEKVNNAFNWIKKQGEKMLSLVLKFFNIQVTTVKLTGKGPELFTE